MEVSNREERNGPLSVDPSLEKHLPWPVWRISLVPALLERGLRVASSEMSLDIDGLHSRPDEGDSGGFSSRLTSQESQSCLSCFVAEKAWPGRLSTTGRTRTAAAHKFHGPLLGAISSCDGTSRHTGTEYIQTLEPIKGCGPDAGLPISRCPVLHLHDLSEGNDSLTLGSQGVVMREIQTAMEILWILLAIVIIVVFVLVARPIVAVCCRDRNTFGEVDEFMYPYAQPHEH